jgi:hypothetical protein
MAGKAQYSPGVEAGEYKGHKTLTLPLGDKRGFSFGVKKAEAILAHVKDIETFVRENSGK